MSEETLAADHPPTEKADDKPDVQTARPERLPPSPAEVGEESVPDRYHRIAAELRETGQIRHPYDQQFLFALYSEQNNAITWDTSCLTCSRLLDGCYEETVKREEAEHAAAMKDLQIAALRAELVATRVPLPIYGTDMNVRHAHTDRLTAYTYDSQHPALGETVIAFDLGHKKAVIARVKDIREMRQSHISEANPPTEQYALDLDWLPEHW